MARDIKHEIDVMEKLLKYDSPSITNVVATYPLDSNCLGLYNAWNDKWYVDQSVKSMYPEIGPRVGYAVTCTCRVCEEKEANSHMNDLYRAIAAVEGPKIVVIKQDMSPEIKAKNGMLGGNMMTAFKSIGVTGVISDGPSRDLDEVAPLKMQYMLSGTAAGHGSFDFYDINKPVEVAQMYVEPGDVIHLDESGAVKFPAEYLDQVLENVEKLQKLESYRQSLMKETNDVEQIIKIFEGLV